MDKHIKAPITNEDARSLKAGDYVYITGTIYTARGRRICESDAMFECKAAARTDLHFIALRQLNSQTGRHEHSLHRFYDYGLVSESSYVHAGSRMCLV